MAINYELAPIGEMNQDEVIARALRESLETLGLHVDLGAVTEDEVTTHYALVMEKAKYERMVAIQNQNSRESYDSLYRDRPYGAGPGWEPLDGLRWDIAITIPSFSAGHDTPLEALLTACKGLGRTDQGANL
jgi:hypothetical protein